MVNNTTVVILGFLIVIIPQLGFPNAWQDAIVTILGILVILLGFRMMRSSPSKVDTYVENTEGAHVETTTQ